VNYANVGITNWSVSARFASVEFTIDLADEEIFGEAERLSYVHAYDNTGKIKYCLHLL